VAGDELRYARDFEIVEVTRESAFDSLGKEFVEHGNVPQYYQQIMASKITFCLKWT
jgi:hypothetical protein